MQQTTLFDDSFFTHRVNVASVPQLSPFRYPGGKTWFIPYTRQWLSSAVRAKYKLHPLQPARFIEPFLGGGSNSLAVASEHMVSSVLMMEIDADVAAVWQTLLNKEESDWLANRICTYKLSMESVVTLLEQPASTTRERSFQTIVKNRVYRGGILAPGSGLLKFGEAGKGIHSRWYPETLAKRIHAILSMHDRLTFRQGDGLSMLAEYADDANAIFFLDPPYTAGKIGKRAGKRLYRHNEIDHEQLFNLASRLRGDFLMTYDNNEEVHNLAQRHGLDMRLIPMKNTHNTAMYELLIGRDLSWVMQSPTARD